MTLVDGVGRPKVIDLPEEGLLPIVLQHVHEGISSGPECRVKFYRTEETDPAGRIVYRMKTAGDAPEIRGRYLLPWKALPVTPKLRIENSTGE